MSPKAPVLDVELLGTLIRTIAHDPELARHLRHLLEDVRVATNEAPGETFEITGGRAQGDWVLSHNERGILQAPSRASLVEGFFSALNELVLDEFSGVAIHAGVVARGTRAIAIPGRSGAGKSTLAAACVAAGFAYVSDEALCLDRDTADVIPYPRPLMLSVASARVLGIGEHSSNPHPGKFALTPADLGGRTNSLPLHLGDVVLATRGKALSLEPEPPAELIPELLERCFAGRDSRAASFELIARAAEGSRGWRLDYIDAIDAAALLRRTLPLSPPAS